MSYALYEKHIPKAQQIGWASARGLFISMLNPKYRGQNFTWERYKEMAVQHAERQAFISFTDLIWSKHESKLLETVRNSAKSSAEECLKESDVESWMPLGELNKEGEEK